MKTNGKVTAKPRADKLDGEKRTRRVSSKTKLPLAKTKTEARGIAELKQAEEALSNSEIRYRRLFEASKDGILILDADTGMIVDVNPFLIQLLGYSHEVFLGKRIWELGFLKDIAANKDNFLELQQKEYIRYEDLPLETANGQRINVEFVSNVYQVDHHKVVQCNIRDITERKKAEQQTQALIESMPDGVLVVNVNGNIMVANAQSEVLFGYLREELLGKPIEMLLPERLRVIHPKHRDGYLAAPMKRTMGSGLELYARRKDGSEFPVDISLSAIETRTGQIAVAAVRDITDRKRAEEELNRSNTELEQFAYVASHDLQEPLRAVAGMVQLLQQHYQGKLDQRADEYIGLAVEASERMQKLINDLLEYSRVGKARKAFEPIDAETVLNVALANLQVTMQESNAVVTHDPLPTVIADSTQLTQVFQNLIGNAIKFRGERPLQIHIGAQKIDNAWRFEVRDNGIGIEAQYYERIFLVFQRLHTRREYPGTGIGLSLCKKILERHGGRIWVEAKPGEGSIFYFTIPNGR